MSAEPMKFIYADPPYLGQCGKMYDHFHNEGGPMPWDGLCWDDHGTHLSLLEWLCDNADGWAYSCNPSDLWWLLSDVPPRIGVWTKTWHQIRPTTIQYAWEPVLFSPARKDNKRSPMVRDWLSCAVAMKTGQRGAKPDTFNDWILDLLVYETGDEFIDLFPGSGSMSRALERHARRLTNETASSLATPEAEPESEDG